MPHLKSMRCCIAIGSTSSAGWGLPYAAKQISIISIAMDAPQEIISALSGKLGALRGVSVKTVYSKVEGAK